MDIQATKRGTRREVWYDAIALSSETMAHLIGDNLYDEIEKAQAAFVKFTHEAEAAYPDWVMAWQAFTYAGHPGYTPRERVY